MIWKYQVGNNIYWVPSMASLVSGNKYKVPVYENYSMTVNTDIKLRILHLLPDDHEGVYFPNHQWGKISIHAYDSSDNPL
jgi:hypothetical protein